MQELVRDLLQRLSGNLDLLLDQKGQLLEEQPRLPRGQVEGHHQQVLVALLLVHRLDQGVALQQLLQAFGSVVQVPAAVHLHVLVVQNPRALVLRTQLGREIDDLPHQLQQLSQERLDRVARLDQVDSLHHHPERRDVPVDLIAIRKHRTLPETSKAPSCPGPTNAP